VEVDDLGDMEEETDKAVGESLSSRLVPFI
jgi:hypothetical protein